MSILECGAGLLWPSVLVSFSVTWQDQVQVSELVPEVASFQGFGVGDFEMLRAGCGKWAFRHASDERLQHRQMGGARFVQPGQHRVNGPYAALRGYEDSGPALARVCRAISIGDRLEGAHDRGPDCDHPVSRRAGRVDRGCGLRRDTVELLIWRLVFFQACYARVQYERHDPDPIRDEASDQLRRKSPSRRRHLGATYLSGVDRLVVDCRPALLDVAVPDG